MPRTRLGDRFAPKAPPLDPAWGAVLCRLKQLDMDLRQLADASGLSYDTVRHTWTKPPIEWPPNQREQILRALKLQAKLVIEEVEQ